MTTHIEHASAAVTEATAAEAGEPVLLVGHSYAGSVIAGIADSMTERIKALVYLDAFLPRDGESCRVMTSVSGLLRHL